MGLPRQIPRKVKKKLTITVDENVYQALHHSIGRRKISGLINLLVEEHLQEKQLKTNLTGSYYLKDLEEHPHDDFE
ncbi:MAG: hypothetical protein V1908_02420 [Candidatus Peregrinibacteria bacterium]